MATFAYEERAAGSRGKQQLFLEPSKAQWVAGLALIGKTLSQSKVTLLLLSLLLLLLLLLLLRLLLLLVCLRYCLYSIFFCAPANSAGRCHRDSFQVAEPGRGRIFGVGPLPSAHDGGRFSLLL